MGIVKYYDYHNYIAILFIIYNSINQYYNVFLVLLYSLPLFLYFYQSSIFLPLFSKYQPYILIICTLLLLKLSFPSYFLFYLGYSSHRYSNHKFSILLYLIHLLFQNNLGVLLCHHYYSDLISLLLLFILTLIYL